MASTRNGISDTCYAKKHRDLMTLISSLRSLGAQAELDLPRIVCIGNQSAGKSSLIEAISQIRVPRDSGTCTRCPTECRLSSTDSPWCANIALRIEFDRNGNRLPETKNCVFGSTITNPNAVELALRCAQTAILNWDIVPHEDFLNMSEESLSKEHLTDSLKFSKNVVCITISGPQVTDLTFVDMPGLIQNATEETVNLVERAVIEQIAGNSIILVTLPMSDDLENQKAAMLAKQHDPEGTRTIGVLTKPDMLTLGATRSRAGWLDIIEGRKQALTHGYYCTRQPEDSDRARGISFGEAREAEVLFFRDTLPWSTSLQSERFGTRNLTEKLSALLSQKIDESLPILQTQLKIALDRTNAELATLPPPLLKDPSSELLALVTKLCASFEAYVDGKRGSERLIQENRKIYSEFKIAIRRTAPDFRPFATAFDSLGDIDICDIIGDEPLPAQYTLVTKPMYLQDVRNHINQARTRELPNNIPFPAKVALIERFTCTWDNPISECFGAVQNQVSATLLSLVSKHISRFPQLHSQVRTLVADEIEASVQETKNLLASMLKFEKFPYTQNDHYYQVCREKFLAHYRAVRTGLIKDGPGTAKRQRIEAAKELPFQNANTNENTAKSIFDFRPTVFDTATQTVTSQRPESPGAVKRQRIIEATKELPSQNANFNEKTGKSVFEFGPRGVTAAQTVTQKPPSLDPSVRLETNTQKKGEDETPAVARVAQAPDVPARSTANCMKRPAPSVASTFEFSIPQTSIQASTGVPANFNSTEHQNEALAALAKLGLHVQVADLHKMIPSDPWEDEMTVAAEVRSYYQTSYKRIIDNVPMIIDNTFFRNLAEKLQPSLILGLGLGDIQRAAAYMAEDDHVVSKREELLSRKKRLENIRQELVKFGY